MIEKPYDRNISVNHDSFDNALTLMIWNPATESRDREVRIPVEDIPAFLRDVVNQGTTALSDAADRLEVGHCETCANTRLVIVPRHGRPWSERCPDCGPRMPSRPYANAPHIGHRDKP